MLKLDQVYSLKNRSIDEEHESFKEKISEMKKACKDKLNL